MVEKEITRIRIGQYEVGIIGIRQIITELAQNDDRWSDVEIAKLMLERLGRANYIPSAAREAYGQAFVREFRRFTGGPCTEETPQGLEIKVLGMGCAQCEGLKQTIMRLLTELNLPAALDHVTDIQEIVRYGVMGTPALVINGKTMAAGKVPSPGKIKEWLIEASQVAGKP